MFLAGRLQPLSARRTPAQHAQRQAKQARRRARWSRRGEASLMDIRSLFAAIPSGKHLPGWRAFLGGRRTRPVQRRGEA